MDLYQLENAQPSRLAALANAYDSLGKANHAHFEAVKETSRWVGTNWSGTAGKAASSKLKQTNNALDGSYVAMQATSALLRHAAEAFELAQSKLTEALAEARKAEFTVGADGSITYPKPSKAEQNDPDYDAPKRASALAERISKAIAEADAVDQKVALRLNAIAQLATFDGLNPEAAQIQLDAVNSLDEGLRSLGWPGKDATAAEVNAWWKGLTPDEQQKMLTLHPDLLGGRNGIPAEVRDKANRVQLDGMIKYLEEKPHRSGYDDSKLEGLKALRDKLAANGAHLNDTDPRTKQPPMFLLGVGMESHGRAIVSYGNPDTADNVSAYVPGLNTRLDGHFVNNDVQRARNIYDAATQNDPTKKNASIVWLDYDAPQINIDGNDPTNDLKVTGTDNAKAGGKTYSAFMQSLRATHEGAVPAHVTTVAHSYGSLTAGEASKQPGGLYSDDVVIIGSPGMDVGKASDLGVQDGHVFAAAAKNDKVAQLPDFTPDPNTLWFGTDPASAAFGAKRFGAPDGPDKGWWGAVGGDIPAHSSYFDAREEDVTHQDGSRSSEVVRHPDGTIEPNESLQAIAQVVSGHGDQVVTVPPR
ncbi:alpha/beta hydrolase [Kitasatospora sp. NPDC059648]|uniref:alpha/beta hydrolase n=1 Tax=Kitasatospora sp. NPDC059648 TaxID=3346894 RepID=UPI00368542EA